MCTEAIAQTGQGDRLNSDADPGFALQEVVVTAQKRAERLQDVPITVEAVSADKVQQLGVTASDDLGNAIPGLMFKKSSAYAAPYLRGIGSVVVAQGDESSVATYVDGVYQVAPSSAMFSLNNIDRIEVLKGPQGTLFGRNANGGVINVITRTPSKDPSVDASFGYGNYDTTDVRFYATGPVGSRAAADLAVYGENQGDGWGRNILLGPEVYKDQ
jgi:iron complex outermembrane receptor protein